MFAATIYLEFWKREEAGIQFLWDMASFEGEEVNNSSIGLIGHVDFSLCTALLISILIIAFLLLYFHIH